MAIGLHIASGRKTACAVRAVMNHGLLYNQQQRLCVYGPNVLGTENVPQERVAISNFISLVVEGIMALTGPDIELKCDIGWGSLVGKAFGISDKVKITN